MTTSTLILDGILVTTITRSQAIDGNTTLVPRASNATDFPQLSFRTKWRSTANVLTSFSYHAGVCSSRSSSLLTPASCEEALLEFRFLRSRKRWRRKDCALNEKCALRCMINLLSQLIGFKQTLTSLFFQAERSLRQQQNVDSHSSQAVKRRME